MITDEDKERVRQATDVLALVGETVELRQRGNTFWGCCPFHQEKSPSFHVDPQTGLWKCFGCGESGDVFAYVMRRESLEFPDAIRYLADRAGIELQEERGANRGPRRNRLIDALTEAEGYYNTMLLRGRGTGPDAGRRYLGGRGFGSSICRSWKLGYAPGNGQLVAYLRGKGFTRDELIAADLALESGGRLRDRFYGRVMFPIHDRQGRTIAFGGRVLDDAKPKYLNTKETPVFHKSKHLFAFDRAKEGMVATGEAIVCEGYTDVIAMHEAGFTNTVAALGTSFSVDHVRAISGFAKSRIICMFDGDAAGQKAAERAVQFLDKTQLDMVCVVLPDNQDPAEYLADHGASAMRDRLAEARPLMDFVFERRLASFDLTVPGQRVAALDSLAEVLAPLKDSILLDGYAAQIAQMLGANVDEVKRRIRDRPDRRPTDDAPRPSIAPRRETYDVDMAALSSDERFQVTAERELLALMATAPDAVRPYGERMATFTWADSRNEVIAWAMLATPEGTSPAGVVSAAESVVPEASRILAGGRIAMLDSMTLEQKVAFLLDLVELASCRREVMQIRGKLRALGSAPVGEDTQALFRRATDLQKRIGELEKQLPSVV
ncbi:MAG: DNA primase [Atopobiaceae bacterium]|nr:DNA primase [Atopobiaceae bacterium]